MANYTIAVLPGDGIGPEVINEATETLKVISDKYGHNFTLNYGLIGGAAIEAEGSALSDFTLGVCRSSGAVLLGAVGDPRYDRPDNDVRPEDGLLAIRKGLGLFANIRPVKVYKELENNTRFKPEAICSSDFVFVRELTGGVYFGRPKRRWETTRGRRAVDSMVYTEQEISRIVKVGFELARQRKKHLISVDKANVLMSSRLWRQVTEEVGADYPDVTLEHLLVDACAMKLIQDPRYFDVVVTENMFGDILTDEASVLAGSLGMLPSASLAGVPQSGRNIFGLYEPVHGSAPTIAGHDIANPIATILTMAMMLRYSFNLEDEAGAIEKAVQKVLSQGYRTSDIMDDGCKKVGTSKMGELVRGRLE
ncbi:MAG: 3-isopropylmalate dehydrogenase [Dehalococcoidales bacterium]|nr:3-isopropylmalate dehydrogenase [Dehalococcoidales bacterium]MDD5122286.1 3-isopropylmalate dehydrogenase [Dehalococcoidales bacterium]